MKFYHISLILFILLITLCVSSLNKNAKHKMREIDKDYNFIDERIILSERQQNQQMMTLPIDSLDMPRFEQTNEEPKVNYKNVGLINSEYTYRTPIYKESNEEPNFLETNSNKEIAFSSNAIELEDVQYKKATFENELNEIDKNSKDDNTSNVDASIITSSEKPLFDNEKEIDTISNKISSIIKHILLEITSNKAKSNQVIENHTGEINDAIKGSLSKLKETKKVDTGKKEKHENLVEKNENEIVKISKKKLLVQEEDKKVVKVDEKVIAKNHTEYDIKPEEKLQPILKKKKISTFKFREKQEDEKYEKYENKTELNKTVEFVLNKTLSIITKNKPDSNKTEVKTKRSDKIIENDKVSQIKTINKIVASNLTKPIEEIVKLKKNKKEKENVVLPVKNVITEMEKQILSKIPINKKSLIKHEDSEHKDDLKVKNLESIKNSLKSVKKEKEVESETKKIENSKIKKQEKNVKLIEKESENHKATNNTENKIIPMKEKHLEKIAKPIEKEENLNVHKLSDKKVEKITPKKITKSDDVDSEIVKVHKKPEKIVKSDEVSEITKKAEKIIKPLETHIKETPPIKPKKPLNEPKPELDVDDSSVISELLKKLHKH